MGFWKNQVSGKTCNKWFFKQYKKRVSTRILSLRHPNQKVEEASPIPAEMCNVVHSYYSDLYTSEEVDPTAQKDLLALIDDKFNEEARTALNADLTIEELEDTLKTMDSNKAPGPDGLSPAFYKIFSDLTLLLILAAYREAFNMVDFLAELSEG